MQYILWYVFTRCLLEEGLLQMSLEAAFSVTFFIFQGAFMTCLQDIFLKASQRRRLVNTSWRILKEILRGRIENVFWSCLANTSWRRLQNNRENCDLLILQSNIVGVKHLIDTVTNIYKRTITLKFTFPQKYIILKIYHKHT